MPLWGHSEFSHINNYDLYNKEQQDKGVYLAKHAMHMKEKKMVADA